MSASQSSPIDSSTNSNRGSSSSRLLMRHSSLSQNNETSSLSPLFKSSSSSSSSSTVHYLLELLKAVRAHDTTVQHVYIRGKRLPSPYLSALLDAIATNPHITRLSLIKVGATDDSAAALGRCLSRTTSVREVNLSKNAIGDLTCQAISKAFYRINKNGNNSTSEYHGVRRLNLDSNRIGDVGIMHLCRSIKQTRSAITTLKLGKNQFRVAGLQAIAQMVTANGGSGVKYLDLRSNHLGSLSLSPTSSTSEPQQSTSTANKAIRTALSILAQALRNEDCSLEYLYLTRNELNSTHAQELALALKLNPTGRLRTLCLQHNFITSAGAAHFIPTLQVNHVFTKLKLRSNPISDSIKAQLLDLLVMNAHGPVVAQETKDALQQVQREQHQQESVLPPFLPPTQEETEVERNTIQKDEDKYDNESLSCCVICYDRQANCILLPCRHDNCCSSCAKRLRGHCHMCRKVIVHVYCFINDDNDIDASSTSPCATTRPVVLLQALVDRPQQGAVVVAQRRRRRRRLRLRQHSLPSSDPPLDAVQERQEEEESLHRQSLSVLDQSVGDDEFTERQQDDDDFYGYNDEEEEEVNDDEEEEEDEEDCDEDDSTNQQEDDSIEGVTVEMTIVEGQESATAIPTPCLDIIDHDNVEETSIRQGNDIV